jgi:hypothetical protein
MTHASMGTVAAIAMLATAAVADAQSCLGLAPFSSGRVQVGGSADFGNDGKTFTGSLSFGSPGGAFGGVSIGTTSYDDVEGNSTEFGGQLGWQLPVGTGGVVQLCPVGGAFRSVGEDMDEFGTDVSGWGVFFGLQLGVVTGAKPQFRIVPTAGAALAYGKSKIESGFINFEDDETFGILSVGVGFLVNSRLSLLPSISVPVGLDDADAVFRIMVAVNFGRGS